MDLSKINLLHIISTLQIGGAEKQVVTLLKNLDKKKYRIILCCLHVGGPLEKEIENEEIEIIFLRFRLRYLLIAMYRLIRLMKKENIQIVHTHLYSEHLWGRTAAWLAGVPVIVATEHGRGLWKKRRHLMFERLANRFTDMRIAVSEDVRQIRIQREHTPSQKVVTVPNAINPDEFLVDARVRKEKREELRLDDNSIIVGTVARFDPDKALDRLLDASSIVLKSIGKVQILLVGDGRLRDYLMDYAAKLGISEKVIFTGARTDIAELLSIMDIYVNSSIREGIPVSLLEAMAAKKAVVATNVGGNEEVINDKTCGIIVDSNDTHALAEGIITLLHDARLRERMGEKARERVQHNYSITAQAKRIESIYENLLRQKTGNRSL